MFLVFKYYYYSECHRMLVVSNHKYSSSPSFSSPLLSTPRNNRVKLVLELQSFERICSRHKLRSIEPRKQRHSCSGNVFSVIRMVDNERENAAEGRNHHVFVPQYRSGVWTDLGIRQTLEDAFICVDDLHEQLHSRGAFYGVFDGHDGPDAAQYAKDNLLDFILQDALFSISVEDAVKNEFLRLDRDFLETCQQDNNLHSGTTALIALLQSRNLLVANAGDCRAVLSRRGQAVELSTDHDTVDNKGEITRIKLAGGTITSDGYVNGQVTVARAIGDWHMPGLKGVNETGPVIAEPEIRTWELSEDDEFLLMGCDGLWNVFTNDQAILFARRQLRKHNDPERCSKALVREALKRKSQDNITVITVCFQAEAPPDLAVVETRSSTVRSFSSLQKDLDFAEASFADRRFS